VLLEAGRGVASIREVARPAAAALNGSVVSGGAGPGAGPPGKAKVVLCYCGIHDEYWLEFAIENEVRMSIPCGADSGL
jgi:hypothetical protein